MHFFICLLILVFIFSSPALLRGLCSLFLATLTLAVIVLLTMLIISYSKDNNSLPAVDSYSHISFTNIDRG